MEGYANVRGDSVREREAGGAGSDVSAMAGTKAPGRAASLSPTTLSTFAGSSTPRGKKNDWLGWLFMGVAFYGGIYFWNMSIAWLVIPVKSFRSQVA